ncbi:early endosome antigen 1 [Chironomus tepperi]|uniref:early endosome antigen 1 n=1 Tax=Chironomus tepperi TaxID=113505 RepID=UPI00391F12EF
MSHLYSVSKSGDQLCPLGFHPQVRWPTRCKRCFRDYKEHGSRRGDEIASSTPSLNKDSFEKTIRSWTSTSNLSSQVENNIIEVTAPLRIRQRPSSWTSTPDLDESQKSLKSSANEEIIVNVQIPVRRRNTANLENVEESFTIKRPSSSSASQQKLTIKTIPEKSIDKNEEVITINKTDSLAERVRKMQLIKRQGSLEREISSNKESSSAESNENINEKFPDKIHINKNVSLATLNIHDNQPSRANLPPRPLPKKQMAVAKTLSDSCANVKKDFHLLVKGKDNSMKQNSSPKLLQDTISVSIEPTNSKLIETEQSELKEENCSLKCELEKIKARCERAEREKSDILLRRLASIDTTSNRSAATEAFKLQQKVNEMKQQIEVLQDDKKELSRKLKEMFEKKNDQSKTVEETLRNKLEQAERMCEALMDENEDMKRELKNMESEMDELQDNFREEQADEYVTVKKELEQTTKNCRILSFKLKKSERKMEQLENEIQTKGNQTNSEMILRIKQLEDELKLANDNARKHQIESEQLNSKKPPNLGKIGKSNSDSGSKFSRESLTRGGSQEDPIQLLRDLQDSAEREADLREQLKFAEEEAEALRKKSSRVEEENESLIMQLKKMATKAKIRKMNPNLYRREEVDKDEGISDEEDTAELKLQLELNEQETAVLRRKVEELEKENEKSKRQIEEMHEKLKIHPFASFKKQIGANNSINNNDSTDMKNQTLFKDVDGVNSISSLIKNTNKSKNIVGRLRSTSENDLSITESQIINLKHQLQVTEQETNILRTKINSLEQENEKLLTEIKKNQMQSSNKKITKGSSSVANSQENEDMKFVFEEVKNENEKLKLKLKLLESGTVKLPERKPKTYSDSNTKFQLKKMIEELENEISETRIIVSTFISNEKKNMEETNFKLKEEIGHAQSRLEACNNEIKLKENMISTHVKDMETSLQIAIAENKQNSTKIKNLEDKITNQEQAIKQNETIKTSLQQQLKEQINKLLKSEKELEENKTERIKLENILKHIRKSSETTISNMKKEIGELNDKIKTEMSSKRFQEIQNEKHDLEESLSIESKKCAELKGQYELLEEEHVLIKAQLTTEKEKLQNEIKSLANKIKILETQDALEKAEKDELKRKIAVLERKLTENEHSSLSKITTASYEIEKTRLKVKLEDMKAEYDKIFKQHEMVIDQLSNARKENDDIKRKLEDFERINKAQRTLNDHNTTLENELRKLKSKLEASEMAVKAEVASTRLRYETQLNTLQNELTSVHRQCERFKKDKDSFKQLLEAAQRNISELKQNRKSYVSTSSGDEDDKSKINALEQQIGYLEDELSESRLDASKLKTEIISEKSAFEIKISEMQSKLNEYEEERILGKSKVPGTKTRLELSWQKEREEQQRLLSETATLARDLRQTLFEVERERDKERLESRRKIEQVKKSTEEELEEGRRKISELQSDLLELRDAHAKLRTANEKIRRDRDRYERERDLNSKKKYDFIAEKKVVFLLQTVDELIKIAPNLQSTPKDAQLTSQTSLSIPNPPRRSKSRSPSPTPNSTTNISTVLAKLAAASEDLRNNQRLYDEEKEREKIRRSGMRRAASQEHENGFEVNSNRPIARLSKSTQNNLYRKSLSLDQSMQNEHQQQIWKDSDVGSMSSVQSIDSEYGIRRGDSSIDSRISVGSTQSDMPNRRKKKKGIMGKLRSLTKSTRGTESDISHQLSDSDISLAGDVRQNKKDFKERISGMFKRSGSASRAGSQEKNLYDSIQRPVSISATLPSNMTIQESLPKTKPPTSQKKIRTRSNI